MQAQPCVPFTYSRMQSRMIPDGWSGTIRDYSVSAIYKPAWRPSVSVAVRPYQEKIKHD